MGIQHLLRERKTSLHFLKTQKALFFLASVKLGLRGFCSLIVQNQQGRESVSESHMDELLVMAYHPLIGPLVS